MELVDKLPNDIDYVYITSLAKNCPKNPGTSSNTRACVRYWIRYLNPAKTHTTYYQLVIDFTSLKVSPVTQEEGLWNTAQNINH